MKRAVLAILGGILGLAGLGLLATGAILLAAFGTDGRAQIPIGSLASAKGSAVVVNHFQIDATNSVPLDDSWFDLSLRVTGNQSHFVAVAPKKETLRYLQGTPYELVTGVDSQSGSLQGAAIPGSGKPKPPESVQIWTDQQTGDDVTVAWPVSDKDISLLVMNEDLSPGVRAGVEVDVRIAWASPAGIGLVVAGLLAMVIGIVLLVLAMRSKPAPVADAWPPPPNTENQG